MRPWVTSRPRFPIAFPTAPPVTSHGVCRSLSAPAGTSIRTGWQMAIPSAGSSSTGRHVGLPASRRNSANADASTRIIRRSSCGARRGRCPCVPYTNDAPPPRRFRWRCRRSCEPSVSVSAGPPAPTPPPPVHRPGVDRGRERAPTRPSHVGPSHARGDGGSRTLTGGGLSALPLPIGLRPRSTAAREAAHRRTRGPYRDAVDAPRPPQVTARALSAPRRARRDTSGCRTRRCRGREPPPGRR